MGELSIWEFHWMLLGLPLVANTLLKNISSKALFWCLRYQIFQTISSRRLLRFTKNHIWEWNILIQTQMVPMKSYLKYLSSSQHVAHQICNVTNHRDTRSSRSDIWTTGLTRGVATSGVPLITPRLDDSILQNVEFHQYNVFFWTPQDMCRSTLWSVIRLVENRRRWETGISPHCDPRLELAIMVADKIRRQQLPIRSRTPWGWLAATDTELFGWRLTFHNYHHQFLYLSQIKLKFSIGSIWSHPCGCHSTKLCWKCTDSFRSQSSCSQLFNGYISWSSDISWSFH